MLKQIEVLGVNCHLFTIDSLNGLVAEKVASRQKTIIANHNLHSVYLYHRNRSFKEFFKLADFVHIDGMPLVYWSKIVGYKVKKENRITYLDWIGPLLEVAQKEGLRVFYLGGKSGVARAAIETLQGQYNRVAFGERDGYFDMSDSLANDSVLQMINAFQPDILMVGMSMPRQELWIKQNLDQLPNCVILPCGACFDYIAGQVKTPPRFLGSIGLEWLYRFFQEPKRLFSRYFVEPVYLMPLLAKDLKNRILKRRTASVKSSE